MNLPEDPGGLPLNNGFDAPSSNTMESSKKKVKLDESLEANGDNQSSPEKSKGESDKPSEEAIATAKPKESEEVSTPERGRSRKRKASESKPNDTSLEEPEQSSKVSTDESSANDNDSDMNMPPVQTMGKGKRARIPNKRYSDIMLSPTRMPPAKTIENGATSIRIDKTEKTEKPEKVITEKLDKHEKIEAELEALEDHPLPNPNVSQLKSRSNSSSPALKKAKIVDLNNPNFRKPFMHGWKRELVYRAIQDDHSSRRNGDIYYYTPTGKKVRSMREVAENLRNKELCLDDFTFFKEPLGLNNPELEIIRDAKVGKKGTPIKSTPIKAIKTPGRILSPKVASPKVAASPKSKTPTPPKSPSKTPGGADNDGKAKRSKNQSNIKNLQVKLPPGKAKAEKGSKQAAKQHQHADDAMEVDTAPSPPKRSTAAANRKSASKAATPTANLDLVGKPCQPCSIRCPGVLGMVPTLQCRLCLCLYHYECIGLSPHVQIEGYVCKNCQIEHGPSVATTASVSLPLNSPSPTSPTANLELQPTVVSTASSLTSLLPNESPPRTEPPPSAPLASQLTTTVTPPHSPPASLPPPPPLMLPKQFPSFEGIPSGGGGGGSGSGTPGGNLAMPAQPLKSLVGSVTSWLPHSSTIQVESNMMMREGLGLPREAPPRPQYVEYLAGRKFLVIPKHNVVSITNKNKVTSENNNHISNGGGLVAAFGGRDAAGRSTEGIRFETQNPFRFAMSHGVALGTPMLNEEPMAVDDPSELGGEEERQEGDDGQDDENDSSEERTPATKPKSTRAARVSNRVPSAANLIEKIDEPKFMDSYLQNLSYGYSTMLYVFQYLKVQDLLRAGCVCTMWRDIANHPSLWRTVRMKNSQVHSFEGLANTLQKHGTVHLDLRKMLLPNNGGDDIWPEFSKAIEKARGLRKIELCRCPASVVEQLAVTNPDLEVINAVTIKCENMSLDQLSNLKKLKELRLKSTGGLTLTSDITALRELVQLKHLSLTSIKDLHKLDLSVIASLTDLESLDLGECSDFPSNFGDGILVKLTKLEKLRLEKGQSTCHTFEILNAVRDMPKLEQLELVNFDIKNGFDLALGACANIKKLLIIPTYISQSATTNHMVLGGVLRLQSTLSHFVWGVTLELLRVTELFVDQCEDPDKKEKKEKKPIGNGDSIPVLKPVPLIVDKDDHIPPAHDPPQVEILPLPNLQKLLLQSLPTTRVKILKIPFHATWRQSITDTVN